VAKLSITLLGDFEVACDSRPVTGLATEKVRALLAFLAAESARPQRRDVLADMLWPDMPPDRARHNLRQSLSRLRTALDSAGCAALLLTDGHELVQLDPSGDLWTDVVEVRALIDANRRHRHRRAESCLLCLRRSERLVELYHGGFLAHLYVPDGPSFEEWALMQREWVRREAIEAMSALVAYYERRGEPAEALRFARRQVALEPWLEEAHRDVMRLLAAMGERSAALAQYEVCRRALATELGVIPTSETKGLAQQIRNSAPPASPAPAGTPLPTIPTRFVGRMVELTQLSGMLADPDCRMITLTGPGGIGKTRLALELAEQHRGLYRDGVTFVTCEALDDCAAVSPAIVEALDLTATAERPAERILCDYLRHREMLLVLDNLERVLGCASVLARLLRASPRLALLTTSHERLRLREEWVYNVSGLAYPETSDVASPEDYDAIALFIARAQQIHHGYSLESTSIADVVAICQHVEGASLALEIAANIAVDRGAAAVLTALRGNTGTWASPLLNVPERHRSLGALCDYAWSALPADEQTILARLAVFTGGLGTEAACLVANASAQALASWSARSLLQKDGDDRYVWHPVMRDYAARRLDADPDERDVARRKHAHHFAGWIANLTPNLHDGSQQEALRSITHDLENLRSAWAWSVTHDDPEAVSQMTDGLYHTYRARGRFEEGLNLLSAAVERWTGDEAIEPLWGRLRARQGALAIPLGRHEEARTALLEALSLSRRVGDAVETRLCLLQLARLARGENRAADIAALAGEALDLARAEDDHANAARALFLIGQQSLRAGDPEGAAAQLTESLTEAEAAGNPRLRLVPLNALGDMACHRGAYAQARDIFRRCLDLSRSLGDRYLTSLHLNNLGTAHHLLGAIDDAEPCYADSLALCRDMGDRAGEAIALSNLGEIGTIRGDTEAAGHAFAAALAIGRALDDLATQAVCLSNLGAIALANGQAGAARAHLAEALRLATASQDWGQVTKSLLSASELLARTEHRTLATATLELLTNHPAAEQQTREAAARLLTGLRDLTYPALPSIDGAVTEVLAALAE
jgi:DNA-binding SARP family transcriptional activator/predicted ATPase